MWYMGVAPMWFYWKLIDIIMNKGNFVQLIFLK